jgi:hypothetical protein
VETRVVMRRHGPITSSAVHDARPPGMPDRG